MTPVPSRCAETADADPDACAILLHGLFRSSASMSKLERALSDVGYDTWNVDYPSTEAGIRELTARVLPDAVAQSRAKGCRKIHLVTHSMGGILARCFLQQESLPEGSRLVMLAPPNRGSEVVDQFKRFSLFQWMNGPAGQELGTSPDSLPNCLGPVSLELGVIAGNRSWNPVFSALIPGEDDGKVSVERTRLPEMSDFLVVRSSHTFIMRSDEVVRQVLRFLECGRFDHSGETIAPDPEE